MRRARFLDDEGNVVDGEWDDGTLVTESERIDADDVTVLPPVEPTKIIGVGPNYYSNIEHYDREEPERPLDLLLFIKPTPTTLVGHGQTAELRPAGEFHYEAEIGVVIGEQCREVDADDAMDYVEGFTCVNEITNKGVPDSMYDTKNSVRKKAFDNSAPIGPAVASPDLVPDDATLEMHVNGELRQHDSRDNLIHAVPALIEEISTYLTLEPGDVIATGSPEGVSQLHDGDVVEVTIEGVGTLRHDVSIP